MARHGAPGGALGLPFRKPDPFPQNALLAARVALYGADHPWGATFSKAVYRAEFGEGRAIAEPGAIQAIVALSASTSTTS